MSKYDFCLGCMNKLGGEKECPKCGYRADTPQKLPALAPGTLLAERYVVGRVVAESGEGFTYIAMDMDTRSKVTIREFLPRSLCTRKRGSDAVVVSDSARAAYRNFLEDFNDIGQAVCRLSSRSAIVPVLDIFRCNSTEYIVYKHVQGTRLTELVRRAKRLSWKEAEPIFMPLISSLISAHSMGLVHFGISPENIYMTTDGTLALGGYGVPAARMAETELDAELYDGYTPLEQYSLDGEKGKWSDIYAISAVLLFALTGKQPPDAVSRTHEPKLPIPAQIAETIPSHVITALAGGLQVYAENRTQSMEELYAQLSSGSGRPAHSERAHAEERERREYAEARREPRPRPAPRQKSAIDRVKDAINDDSAWYKNLSQFQYWLLTTCLGIIVLGIIAVIVFINVRPLLNKDGQKPPTIIDSGLVSGAEVALEADMYVVPDLRGLPWNEAKNSPDYMMFDLIEVGESYSDDYEVGEIMKQSIAPNEEVQMGTPIAITVSLGSEMCIIPNIVGKTIAEADEALTAEGLVLGNQTEQYSDSVPQGCIISITGASVGSRMKRGSMVDVVVSLGSEA